MRRDRFKSVSFGNGSQETIGPNANSTTGSSYPKISQELVISKPLYLNKVEWDISLDRTVDLQFVDSLAASPVVLDVLATGVSVSASSTHTFTIPSRLLKPGIYFLELVFTSSNSTTRIHTGDAFEVDYTGFYWGKIYTTSIGTANTAACRLVGTLFSDWELYYGLHGNK